MGIASTDLPLEGITILDLTRVLAGPYCTRLLADLGARVIKIERIPHGDDMRFSPHQIEPGRRDQSSYFARVNAGKESVGIDLSHPDGLRLLLDLARHADVFIENFAPGVVKKLGCDVSTVRAVKPDIVYCSISGYGQTGPWRNRPAFAHTTNAISGMMFLEQGDEPVPRASNLQAADVLAANHAASAILAALLRRMRNGQGAYIDVSMLESLIGADSVTFPSMLNGGASYGNPRPGLIVCAIGDRHLALQIIGANDLWDRLLTLIDDPTLSGDARFASPEGRAHHARELHELIGQWIGAHFNSVDEALAALQAVRVPCAPVLQPQEVIESDHLAERGFFPVLAHTPTQSVRVTASPYQLDGAPVQPTRGAPRTVGHDTARVLSELLGLDENRIGELADRKVIARSAAT